jgi:hypothetical protein
MKTFRNNPEHRLASINAQIDSLQTRLQGLVVDGRHHLLGPVETSFLEIEIAELRVEYNGLIAKLPM